MQLSRSSRQPPTLIPPLITVTSQPCSHAAANDAGEGVSVRGVSTGFPATLIPTLRTAGEHRPSCCSPMLFRMLVTAPPVLDGVTLLICSAALEFPCR